MTLQDSSVSWPPPDPDRIPRVPRSFDPGDAFIHQSDSYSDKIEVGAFRKRQQEDMMRFQSIPSKAYRRVPFHDRYSSEKDNEDLEGSDGTANGSSGGEEGWRNSEGDRLRDFGVDEDAEFYDEDDIPLSELLQRRKEVKVSIDRSIAMGRSD